MQIISQILEKIFLSEKKFISFCMKFMQISCKMAAAQPKMPFPVMGSSAHANYLEFLLHGSCLEDKQSLLLERLRGISDPPGGTSFKEHEMSFVQSINAYNNCNSTLQ